MVLFGFFLKKKKVINEDFQKKLSGLLINAILPISILTSANSEYSKELSNKLLQSAGIAAGYYIVAIVIMGILCKHILLGEKKKSIFKTMSVFANTAFIGFPIVGELYGPEGTLYTVIYNLFYQLFLFTYGIKLLSGQDKFEWKSLYKDVSTMVSVLAIFIFISPFRFPGVIVSTLGDIGNMMVPLSMIIIGCGLADLNIMDLLNDKFSFLVSALRLLIFPTILLVILKMLQIDTVLAASCVLITALPAGSLNVVLAEQYDCEPKFAAQTVIQSMVFMVITLPIIILLINQVL